MTQLILGTAGHIDHGKTALVRALTGTDTDRLPEEKRRGITIDLGFARLPLSDDLELAVVDVPGHEAFVRNMLAGATGFDLALLVVAADEGVMPQTREHLAIIELLGVRAGVVAVTKTDLVDAEWLGLVLEDLRVQLQATSFASAPVVPVSAVTGSGLEELRVALRRAAAGARPRTAADLFRLPIDRIFTVHGTGTVVTGTVWSGSVRPDDALNVLPSGLGARARAVQVHGAPVEAAGAGQRAAVALAGMEREQLSRGDVLVREAGWSASTLLTARVRVIPGSGWELAQRQRIRFHLGTAEVLGRVRLFGVDRLVAGGPGAAEAWAQIGLESPVVARAGDRFVLRSYSPVTTIGGGTIYEPAAGRRRRMAAGDADMLERLVGPSESAVVTRIALAGWQGVEPARLAVETPHTPADVSAAVEAALTGGSAAAVGERLFVAEIVQAARGALLSAVDAFHEREPLRPGIDRQEVRRALPAAAPPGLADWVLESLLADGTLAARGDRRQLVARKAFQPRLSDEQASARARLARVFLDAGLAPPAVDELPEDLRRRKDFWPLLKLLETDGTLVNTTGDAYMSAAALDQAVGLVRERLAGKGPVAPTEFKTLFPLSRKHLIPLLELFDHMGVTVRSGNDRVVKASG